MSLNANNILISGGQLEFNVNKPQEEQSAIKSIVDAFQGHYVARATHDNNEILNFPTCQPGTFVSLLDRLSNWMKDESSPMYICWLHGPEGVGKSAVTRSLAKILQREGLLAGTFFFSREDAARNSQKPLVATLAQQLADSRKETRVHIAASLLDDPAIISKSLETQFENLIASPIIQLISTSTQTPSFRPALMVIDGLDECEDPMARHLILNTLCTASARLHGMLRFLIASRPEDDIHTFLQMKADTMGEHINFIDVDMHVDLNQELPSQIPLTVPVANDTSRPPSPVQQISLEEKPPSPTRTVPVQAGTSISLTQVQPKALEDLSPKKVTIVDSAEFGKSSFVKRKATGVTGVTRNGLKSSTKDISSSPMSKAKILDNPYEVTSSDKIIAVMGPTGSGKSQFIDTLAKSTILAGPTLVSVTQVVISVRLQLLDQNGQPGQEVVLVDTPGFDDTMHSDVAVLELIGEWLKRTYKNDIKLTGILYMHRITDNRMAGTSYRNLRMFGKLCGDNPARKVIFVTTMWDKIWPDKGELREAELRKTYWTPMLQLGARTARFNLMLNAQHCHDLVGMLLNSDTTTATLIQEETVERKRAIIETEAAKTLYSHMQVLLSQHKESLTKMQEAAKRTNNPKMLVELENEKQRIQAELDKTFKEARKLKIPLSRRMMLFFSPKPKARAVDFSSHS